jgi:hypothetical protein
MSEPSRLVLVKPGKRETETTLIDAHGLAVMQNADGSIVLELYGPSNRANSYRVRLSPQDVWENRETWRGVSRWVKPPEPG